MTVYAFGQEEHTYFNSGGHKGDLYYYTLGGRLLGALDNTGKTTFYLTDALGSVLASFSSAAGIAAIKGNQVFGPYGNARDFQGAINTARDFTRSLIFLISLAQYSLHMLYCKLINVLTRFRTY